MENKTLAFISVFLMLASGFTVLAVVGDNTDTSSAVRDYTGRTTLSISSFAYGGSETFNITYGTYVDLTEQEDDLDGFPAGYLVTDKGNANQFGLTGTGNEVKGYLNKIGSFTFRLHDYNGLEDYSLDYYCTINVVANETITWANGQDVSNAVEIRSTPAEIDSSMIEFRNSSWQTSSLYSGVTYSTVYEPDQDLNVIEFGGQMNANVTHLTTMYMVIPSERYAVALVATPYGTAEAPVGDIQVHFGGEYYVAKGSKLTFINESEVGVLDDGEEFTDWEVGTIPSPKTSVSSGYQWTADTPGDYTVNFGRYLHCFDPQSEEFYEEPQGSGSVVIHIIDCSHSHTITYSANGGTGTTAPTVHIDNNNGYSSVVLDGCGFVKAGYQFIGWKIGNTVYQPGQSISIDADTSINAVAQWTPVPVNITSSDDDADIVVGNSFSRAITTDVAGTRISFTGPNWLTLSGSTLVGTPSVAGDYTVTVNATNGVSSDSQTFGIHVVNRLAFESVPTGGILATPVI